MSENTSYAEELVKLEADIADKIKDIRIAKGVSQQEVAEILGVSFQQVQKYESGVNRISPGRLFLFSRYMGIPVTYFFETDDTREENTRDVRFPTAEEREIIMRFKAIDSPKVRKTALKLCDLLVELGKCK